MEIKNGYYRVSIKALIYNEDRTKFLLVQEDNGKWELPGGGLDWGEKPTECLVREIREEMGIEVLSVAETPSYFLSAQRETDGMWKVNVLYETVVKDLDFTPSTECIALKFMTKEEAEPMDLYVSVREFLKLFNSDK